MTFKTPVAVNSGLLSGDETSDWVGNNREEFVGNIANQGGVDASDPAFTAFAENVARQLAEAGSTAIDDGQFYPIIKRAIQEEINAAGKNVNPKVKEAFADAKGISSVQIKGDRNKGERLRMSQASAGMTTPGGPIARHKSYKGNPGIQSSLGQHGKSDAAMIAIAQKRSSGASSKPVKAQFDKGAKSGQEAGDGLIDGVKKTLQIASPSKKMFGLGKMQRQPCRWI